MILKNSWIFNLLFLLGMAGSFSACGPVSHSRKITIDAVFRVGSGAPYNMSDKFTNMFTAAIPCVQNQIYLVVFDQTTNQFISTQQVLVTVNSASIQPAYTISPADIDAAITMITQSSIPEPLIVELPEGPDQYQVGIIGQFYNPIGSDVNGFCVKTVGGFANESSALFGKSALTKSAAGTLTLDVHVIHSVTSADTNYPSLWPPTSGYQGGYWTQFDMEFDDTSSTTHTAGNARLRSISYLNGLITAAVDYNGTFSSAAYYVPNIFPNSYTLTFADANATYTSTAVAPSVPGNINPLPNPLLVSGTSITSFGAATPITITQVTGVTGSATVSAAGSLTITSVVGGICNGTLVAPIGGFSAGIGTVTFNINTPKFSGVGTEAVSSNSASSGTYTGSCPVIIPNTPPDYYGIISH